MSDGRTAPRKAYSRAWLRVFAVLDPEHEGPLAFLQAVGWNGMDLTRLTRGLRIKDDKLVALDEFCATHRIALPLESTHAAMVRLREVRSRAINHVAQRTG